MIEVPFADSLLTREQSQEMYRFSVEQPEAFWSKVAEEYLFWKKKWNSVLSYDYHNAEVSWFKGGVTNACYNCVDRHLADKADQPAILWEGNELGEEASLSYQELHLRVSRFANVLKKCGVEKGDRVVLYMPLTPDVVVAMLACARIGAIHSVVFAGFSAEALKSRIIDCAAKVVVTADEMKRGDKLIPLKEIVDRALEGVDTVKNVIVTTRGRKQCQIIQDRDVWFEEIESSVSDSCEIEWVESEDPLFILYTSGSTGKPKGVLHTTAGYLLYVNMTYQYVFNHRPGQVHFCAADVGWITGHSYVVYGPLAAGGTTVLFEPPPVYPTPSRYWQTIEKLKVNSFYTAPTAIRALMKEGDRFLDGHDLSSLKIIGSVGEPINETAWWWYFKNIGKEKCPVVDTWWQTETGGILITPLPRVTALKPSYATLPFFGIRPVLVNDQGEIQEGAVSGKLCIEFPWPGQMRGVYGDKDRFRTTYFSQFPGKYFTGDGAIRDEQGFYRITGRVDDVINISGHRIGTAEVESAIASSGIVVEAAVVGMPHDIKGSALHAFCVLSDTYQDELLAQNKIKDSVKRAIGSFAVPDKITIVSGLPKTRSGKLMRRILRALSASDLSNLGDITTLSDPLVVDHILKKI